MLDPCNFNPSAVDGRLYQMPVHEQVIPHTAYAEILGALDDKVESKSDGHVRGVLACETAVNALEWRDCQRFVGV